jgi:putative ABC transport system permease protein
MAVVIMFVEAGMLSGVLNAQANLANLARADLVIMSRLRSNLHNWTRIRMAWLVDAAGTEGVARLMPIYQSTMAQRSVNNSGRPREVAERETRDVVVLAFAPEALPFDIGNDRAVAEQLKQPNSVVFDRQSRPIYGKVAQNKDTELNFRPWHVNGLVDIGPDIVNDGTVVMSAGNWKHQEPDDQPIMGMIRILADADVETVRRKLIARLPTEVSVLTPSELRMQEFDFTLRVVPIGLLFGLGMLAGLVIGGITCYQVLYNAVHDRLATYTTLKAMGFSTGFLHRVILEQALLLSLAGGLAGVVLATGTAAWLARRIGFGIHLTILPSIAIIALATGAACVAGLLAGRRVVHADPASLL